VQIRHWLGSLVLVAIAGCKSDTRREAERVDASLSWVATAGTVTKGWVENRLPVRYVERVLGEAHEELARNDEAEGVRIVETLRDAVRRRDAAATREPMASLLARWSALQQRSEQMKSQ